MSTTLPTPPAPLGTAGFLPRVTRRDGRAIEEALAGATLLDEGVTLDGVVIEAAYALDRPPLLKRLRDDHISRIVDPQTLRFAGPRYLEVEPLARLPYAPERPLEAASFDGAAAQRLARDVLMFEQEVGADLYLAPGLPLPDRDLQSWLLANDRALAAACAANGAGGLDRKPLLACVAPGARAQANPQLVVNRLIDYPIDGVYVQALRLDPVRDSLEKLARFVQFLHEIASAGLPVIVGRVGAFGLVLQALGIPLFDSGLGQAEAHDLASLNRPSSEREREQRELGESGGGPASRVYLEPLKTTLQGKHAQAIVDDQGLRARFVCQRGCCRFRGFETLVERGRQHCLWTRSAEVAALRSRPVAAMRLAQVEAELRTAKETAAVVRRALALTTPGLPSFAHIDRWLGLLAREQQLALPA